VKRTTRSILLASASILVALPAGAASLIGTSTSSEVFHSAARFHVHYVNGHYWVAYHDGVKPVLASSADGVSWAALGAIFSSFNPSDAGEWAVRFSGSNIVALAYNGADTDRYYRNGTLNANGTVTWNAADAVAGPNGSSWTQLNALIANQKPVMWRASTGGQGGFRRGNQLNAPTWTAPGSAAPSLSTATGGGYSAGAISPSGGPDPDDLIVLRATTSTTYTAGNHRLVALKYDVSADAYDAAWYNVSTLGGTLTEDPTTEVQARSDNIIHKRFAAVRDSSGNLHAVYVNGNNAAVHYRKAAGFNDSWSRISSDVTQSVLTIDKVALTAAGNNNIYLLYAKTDKSVYYRRFDGTSWSAESFVYNASATDLNDALGVMESTNGCQVALAFSEGLGPTYNVLFTLVGPADCGPLTTSQGAGTLTVTAPASFEMTFSTQAGGGMITFYDLAEDPSKLYDLAGALTSSGSPWGLHNSGMRVGGTNYNAGTNNVGSKLDLLEATPTRVRLRQESFYENNGTGIILGGVKGYGDYSVLPSGKIALRWNRRTTQLVNYDTEYHELMLHQAAAPLDNWATYSETDGIIPPDNPGTDDFLLARKDVAGVRTDFLHVISRDWTTLNGHFADADLTGWNVNVPAERVNLYWVEITPSALPANSSETWNFLTYFKANQLGDNTDPAALERRDDYRSPDSLAVMVGSPWIDASENTGGGDDFNESEAAYALTFDPALGLSFDIDGVTTTRYSPFFKIRQWRSLQDPPSVTLEGVVLANDIDFRADVKPVSSAHWANTLSWHCTVQDPVPGNTCVSGVNLDVGSAGTFNGTVVAGKYGNGGLLDTPGAYISAGAVGSLDFSFLSGTVELWYQPNAAHTDGTRHLFWANMQTGDCLVLEKTSTNELRFVAVANGTPTCGGGTTLSVTVPSTSYSWRAKDWVHLRAAWRTSGPKRLQLFLNGVELGFEATYSGAGMGTHGPTYFGGCPGGNCPFGGSPDADGIIDEPHIYVGAVDNPQRFAQGGLVGATEEYLADSSAAKNFGLGFSGVDTSRRGQYVYFGSDSKFRGLNVALATAGAWSTPGDLVWEYWNGAGWVDLESGFGFTDQTNHLTRSGTIYWTGDPFGWSPYSVNGGPDLYYLRAHLAVGGTYATFPMEGLIKTDILLFQYCGDITANAQTFAFGVPSPTAVELVSFAAHELDAAVELLWETASELKNLGFHLYRANSEEGAYQRITATPIPGLGSSPSGARYRYVDSGLVNGRTYFYKLEDIETTGKTKLHGPVSATPAGGAGSPDSSSAWLTYGDPSAVSLRVIERSLRQMVVELLTGGFRAEPQEDGSVRISIPDFVEESEPGSPAIPVKRSWLAVQVGREVRLASVRAEEVEAFSSLRPEASRAPEVIASQRGTVRAGLRRQGEGRAFRQGGLYPEEVARLLSVGYQAEEKKALLELAPLRWNRSTGELLLARRLVVRLVFSGREAGHRERGGHDRRTVTRRLIAREKGLYAVSFEQVMGSARRAASSVRLSRQGEPVAYHLDPENGVFAPGSKLYFVSEGASLNPYGSEAVYELELGAAGQKMPAVSALPSGPAVGWYWQTLSGEENRYYQAGLLEAEDVWLWDPLFAPATRSYPFEVSALASSSAPSLLEVGLQGVSDLPESPDHHLRVSVNGTPVAESTLEGKKPLKLRAEIPAGVLREGENALSIENVGDAGASYSMVMLDRFWVRYPRRLVAERGKLEGSFGESGTAEVEGIAEPLVVDLTERPERWLRAGAGWRVQAGRSYLVVSREAVLKPEVRNAPASRLKSASNRADYLLLGPRELLAAAGPLLDLRRSQGLTSRAVAVEDVYSEFGFGESAPEAVREFISYTYHHWRKPSLRYVLLLGDGTYDFKDYLATGVSNRVPPLMVKTSYLWTASDAGYGSVNGEDVLPDVAVGRLPAKTVEEARVMVEKVLAYEAAGSLSGPAVLVADNGDQAGDFEADAEEIAAGLLASRNLRKIYLGRLGVELTRAATLEAFDSGAGLLSYLGHGGIRLWASENLFSTTEVSRLEPQPQQPVVLTLNCLNGYFHFPYFNSLAEELVKAEGKGAIAAFSPSGLSLNGPAHLYHQALLKEILSGKHRRLGDALLAAQAAYADSGAFPELLRIYLLLGDPALTLR